MARFPSAFAVCLALGLVGCAHLGSLDDRTAGRTPAPWAHEISDLKPDSRVTWGRLENGLRYAILPHAMPRQRASVFLLVQAGSYHERGSELGYAHFVEHMAFRGMRGFPADGFAQVLQRLGVSSGAHVNAGTSPFETKYYLNHLPSDEPVALATGIKIMRAIADGVLFDETAVEQERGVIFAEVRSREGMLAEARPDELEFLPPRSQELRWPELAALFDRTRMVKRYPLGDERTLQAATAKKLRAFYDRWYRPERMVLVVVGDIAAAETERLVREEFATLAGRGRGPSEIAIEKPPGRTNHVSVYVHASASEPAMHVTLSAVRANAVPDTISRRREGLLHRLALGMLERRLARLTDRADAPFTSAEATTSHIVPGFAISGVRAVSPTPRWQHALAVLDLELRRAGELGFADMELERLVESISFSAGAAARQARAETSPTLASALAFSVARGVVFTAAEDDYQLTKSQLQAVTLEESRNALGRIFPPGNRAVSLLGPVADEKREGELAVTVLAESAKKKLTAYDAPPKRKPFPHTDFGPPGRIAKRQNSETLGAELIEFENGVRLNLKRTDFEPGRMRLVARFGGGRAHEPAHQPGLSWCAFAWMLGGIRDFPRDDERVVLSGLIGSSSMSVNGDDFRLFTEGDPESILLRLQLAAAYFVRPAFRDEDWPRALEIVRQVSAPYENTALGVARSILPYRMSSQHISDRPPRISEISQYTPEAFKAWFLPQLSSGPLEIAMVGDFDSTEVIDSVSRTLGALPARATTDPYASDRAINFPPKTFSETIAFDGKQGVAVVALAWPASEVTTFSDQLRAHLLADILADRLRLKLRDEMGETYSTSATFAWSDAFNPTCAFLRCSVEAAPERVDRVAAAIREVAETLARGGATAEEFERARRPRVREMETGIRDNSWWLDVISVAQSNPAYGEGWAGALDGYRSATSEQINDLARRVLTRERECRLLVVPQPPTARTE